MWFEEPAVGTRKLALLHVFYNLFTGNNHRVKGRCNVCGRPIFSEHRRFAKKGLCLYCASAYTDGLRDRLVQAFDPKLQNWMLIDTITGAVLARSGEDIPFTHINKAEPQEAGVL